MNELILNISNFEFLKIIPCYNINFQQVKLCTNLKIYFQNQSTLCIDTNEAGEIFRSLISHLEKAVDNKLQLHESLTQNIGFMYNEYFDNRLESMMVYSEDKSKKHWVMYDYKMWSGSTTDINNRITTWLYNDKDGNIILEMTKTYSWFYIQDSDIKRSDFVYYEDFIKDYKSLAYCIISQEIATSWLKQAKKLLQIFAENEKGCTKPIYYLKNE